MNKYCLWNCNAEAVLFKYRYKKKYKTKFDTWESYCAVNKILRNTQDVTIKKIDKHYYIKEFHNSIICFWNNNATYNIEFEAENDEEALLRAELYE